MGYGIEFTDTVDLITINAPKKYVALIVVGPEAWTGSALEQTLLAQKLDSYVRFVEDGQLQSAFPESRGLSVRFRIDTATVLPEALRAWIHELAFTLRSDHCIELYVMDV